MVGAGDDLEGCVGVSAVAGWFDSALRKTAGRLTTNGGVVRHGPTRTLARLTTNGLGAQLVEDGLEMGGVEVLGVAGALDEEGGDWDVGEVGDGVVEKGVPAGGVDVADEAADVGAWFLGEEEGHDLAAHGASGEEEGKVGGEGTGGLDGNTGGLEEDFERVDEVFAVAVLEAVAVGVVVAEGGDAVAGEGFGHSVHEGGAHGGSGAVAEEHEGNGVVGLVEEGGEVGAGGG